MLHLFGSGVHPQEEGMRLGEEISQIPYAVEISGKVTDENGEPIPGATVVVEGTNIGTVTDIDGNFDIDAEKEQ